MPVSMSVYPASSWRLRPVFACSYGTEMCSQNKA